MEGRRKKGSSAAEEEVKPPNDVALKLSKQFSQGLIQADFLAMPYPPLIQYNPSFRISSVFQKQGAWKSPDDYRKELIEKVKRGEKNGYIHLDARKYAELHNPMLEYQKGQDWYHKYYAQGGAKDKESQVSSSTVKLPEEPLLEEGVMMVKDKNVTIRFGNENVVFAIPKIEVTRVTEEECNKWVKKVANELPKETTSNTVAEENYHQEHDPRLRSLEERRQQKLNSPRNVGMKSQPKRNSPPRNAVEVKMNRDKNPTPPNTTIEVEMNRGKNLTPPNTALERNLDQTFTPPRTAMEMNRDKNLTPPNTAMEGNHDQTLTPPNTAMEMNRDKNLTPPNTAVEGNHDQTLTPPNTAMEMNRDKNLTPPNIDIEVEMNRDKNLTPPDTDVEKNHDQTLTPPNTAMEMNMDSEQNLSPPNTAVEMNSDQNRSPPNTMEVIRDLSLTPPSAEASENVEETMEVDETNDRDEEFEIFADGNAEDLLPPDGQASSVHYRRLGRT